MTKIAVAGPASGTGTFTLTTPVSSSDRTLTFPDSTGTVLNDQSNIEAQVKTATSATGAAPIFSCRAWCNFNGTGTVAIRASGNVSSITDNGVGDYTINFTTAMPDANYVVQRSVDFNSLSGSSLVYASEVLSATTSSVQVDAMDASGSRFDVLRYEISIFR